MTQFDSYTIYVNGYNLSERLGLNSYTIKNTSDKLFGINRTMETEESLNGEIYVTGYKNTRPQLDVELARVDKYGNTAVLTDDELDELGRILFSKKVCELEANGMIYYGGFVDGTYWRNPNNMGFVCLKYELALPYAFTRIYTDKKRITDSKIIEINNIANSDEYEYLDVELKQLGTTPIEIINMTTGESLKIKNMELNEEIEINSEEKEIYSITNPNKNMFSNVEYNRYFPRLRYGKNRIKVIGNCIISFKHQAKMLMK